MVSLDEDMCPAHDSNLKVKLDGVGTLREMYSIQVRTLRVYSNTMVSLDEDMCPAYEFFFEFCKYIGIQLRF